MPKVVESKVYVGPSGRTFSPFSSYIEPGSKLETRGFTIAWDDGTQGTGRVPFKTREEAEAFLIKHPRFSGMNQH